MAQSNLVDELSSKFNVDLLRKFLQQASDKFKPEAMDLTPIIVDNNESIKKLMKIGHIEKNLIKIGHIDFDETQQLIVVVGKLNEELTSRTSKARQYKIGKEILKQQLCEAGIFVFHDDFGNFRFSLITAIYFGYKKQFSYYRRYTYFVSPVLTNKTFKQQIGKADFTSLETIQKAFSIEAVTNEFYGVFKPKFDTLALQVKGQKANEETKENFALLFVIRLIFIGFVQKRGWLDRTDFILSIWQEYLTRRKGRDTFYKRWLEPLFFEALNTPPGHKVMFGNNEFSPETENIMQMAPYLNGELFKRINGIDDLGLYLPDDVIGDFIEFLFQYNFTVEENSRYDEELELNPEFLGIIFERLVNKADGAVYTPRVEVDFMCRLTLVKWLEKNSSCRREDLYYLFFREEDADHQIGDLNNNQEDIDFNSDNIRELCSLLENITVCDPAAGSGAFEVGMLQVLSDVIQYLQNHPASPADMDKKDSFDLKKELIANCLYGVEVKPWAVWINQLRLWLTLFIDMPDDYKQSFEPLLPSLNFKIRCGDSLVQQIAGKTFPIHGHADLSANKNIKKKITELKKDKANFFYNRVRDELMIKQKEIKVFQAILDAEIMTRKNTLLFYEKNDNFAQGSIFGETENGREEKTIFDQQKIDAIKDEIESLQRQKEMLQYQHPFIWNIEFAEVFFQNNHKNRQGFDIIIGNPPYVRQEDISDPCNNLTPAEYKAALIDMAKSDFDYFSEGKKIDGRSDLYTFFFLRSLRLLNPQGIHCFICSNSWLDAGYGVWLQEFLLKNVAMHYIIDNHAKRSFASADVNTIISLFAAPGKADLDEQVKFVAFKKPFEEVVYTEILLEIETTSEIHRNENFRIYPITTELLLVEGYDDVLDNKKMKYVGDKWGGRYLKAPEIFFTVIKKGKNKMFKLKEFADIKFGLKTGCNEFFYLTKEQARTMQIEDKYLKPAILKTAEAKQPDLTSIETEGYFFWCSERKNKLRNTNAIKYITAGENTAIKVKQGRNKGEIIKGFNNIETVKNRSLWYSIANREPAPIWWIIAHNDRSVAFRNKDIIPSDNFFEIIPNNQEHIEPIYLYLNSTIMTLFRELYGRTNFGGGVLKTQKPDLQKSLILHPKYFNSKSIAKLNYGLHKTESIFTECDIDPKSETPIEKQEPNPMPHRAALDKIVFDALDLTEEERREVYRAVCRLVWNRVSKAQSV